MNASDSYYKDVYHHLALTDMSTNPAVLNHTPLFISKWIDYSNKYGFGYQLSDNCVGVFFNDLTRISISPDKR